MKQKLNLLGLEMTAKQKNIQDTEMLEKTRK